MLLDELSHACLWAGAHCRAPISRLTATTISPTRRALLKEHRKRHGHALIATDGVFSMDGDLAPLPELGELAKRYDAWLLADDAHGLGVTGGGRGSAFAHDRQAEVPLQMGTLSKAAGGYGGYLCASRDVVDLVKNRARSFVYSTGLPPASVAGAIAALDIIARGGELVAAPLIKARAFTAAAGLDEAQSPIVPVYWERLRARSKRPGCWSARDFSPSPSARPPCPRARRGCV